MIVKQIFLNSFQVYTTLYEAIKNWNQSILICIRVTYPRAKLRLYLKKRKEAEAEAEIVKPLGEAALVMDQHHIAKSRDTASNHYKGTYCGNDPIVVTVVILSRSDCDNKIFITVADY